MENNRQTQMQFDFKRNGSSTEPLLFSNPKEIITTRKPAAVPDCLQRIDDAIAAGFYAAGYISYEAFDSTPGERTNTMPLLSFGIFDTPAENRVSSHPDHFSVGSWHMLESASVYKENVSKILAAIERGQLEEVNYTVPFEASFTGDAFAYYEQLQRAQSSNYCAYLSIDGYDILSASPELFFQLKNEEITVRPMKGTIHRGNTYEDDLKQQQWLRMSEKNKSENMLTLELMKQELKKITVPGSTRMIDLYRIEKYPTVYQMTSGLKGNIIPGNSVVNILKALFPCGSIAGVPKASGQKLIRELEKNPREVYCGAIGYITPESEAIFNVPIRTVWIDRKKNLAHYGAGGAITAHSLTEEEFQEVQTKSNVLTWKPPEFELLETLGLYDGSYVVLEKHLKRLRESADYFDIPVDIAHITHELADLKVKKPAGNWRVRLTVSLDGKSTLTSIPLEKNTAIQQVKLAAAPIDMDNRYLYHKTTNRAQYDTHTKNMAGFFDVLLWNTKADITEFTIGNVVAEINGVRYTPPVSSGLLPGTFRAHLLEEGAIQERHLSKQDVLDAEKLWLINSVRQWVEVKIV